MMGQGHLIVLMKELFVVHERNQGNECASSIRRMMECETKLDYRTEPAVSDVLPKCHTLQNWIILS